MAQAVKDNRIVIKGDQVRAKLLEGARAVYDTVSTTYGAKGRNVLIEKPFGRPMLTRDGVTVARDTYFSDRAMNMGSQLVLEASELTNRSAGDGTSATSIMAYNLMKNGAETIQGERKWYQFKPKGLHPMVVRDALFEDSYKLLDRLAEISQPAKDHLVQVATTSSGDALLGQLIAGAIEHVGADGGIITEKAHIQDVEREYVDGYYLQTGFEALQQGRKELADPFVVVSSKRLSSAVDAVEVMTKIMQIKQLNPQAGQIPRILFVGNIEDAAYNLIVDNVNQGRVDAVVIKTPPQFAGMAPQLLEDIATYAGCKPIAESTNLKSFDESYIGTISKIVATKTDSTLFADNTTEAVEVRISEIKDLIAIETVPGISEKLRDRVAKLQGKIALFRIGGASDTEKEEKEFRVEDAIQATRAAFNEGIVPGGGVTLLELSKIVGLSDMFRDALQATFKKLLTNAALPAEVKLQEALNAPQGYGFNLRKGAGLVDVIQEGVIDPTLVVKEVIRNATSVAANALTTDVLLIFEDAKE